MRLVNAVSELRSSGDRRNKADADQGFFAWMFSANNDIRVRRKRYSGAKGAAWLPEIITRQSKPFSFAHSYRLNLWVSQEAMKLVIRVEIVSGGFPGRVNARGNSED